MDKKSNNHPHAKADRNMEIFKMRKSGVTYKKIADVYGITEKRVRTIIDKLEEIGRMTNEKIR